MHEMDPLQPALPESPAPSGGDAPLDPQESNNTSRSLQGDAEDTAVITPPPANDVSHAARPGAVSYEDAARVSAEEADVAGVLQRLEALGVTDKEPSLPGSPAAPQRPRLLKSFDLEGVAGLIRAGRAQRIVCMVGAGISVTAGIPDFRTPGTGLYSRLAEYNLPRPEAVFSLDFFRPPPADVGSIHRRNPEPFYQLARELLPGKYRPTPTHHFVALLHRKGLLLRCFTQNIDSLETVAGLPAEKLVAAHGNFDGAACIKCKRPYDIEKVKANIMSATVTRCKKCSGLVKPDIVFFGESLPDAFHERRRQDLPECDLLIVMGTSLVVYPFAGLLYDVAPTTPRLLINRDPVGLATELDSSMWRPSPGFQFLDPEANTRDAAYLGDCDDGVRELCALLGWHEELRALIEAARDGPKL